MGCGVSTEMATPNSEFVPETVPSRERNVDPIKGTEGGSPQLLTLPNGKTYDLNVKEMEEFNCTSSNR